VRVLEPIPTEGLSLADLPMLRERVRTLIGETRQALFRELESQPASAAIPS
jgi:hypothetical protein